MATGLAWRAARYREHGTQVAGCRNPSHATVALGPERERCPTRTSLEAPVELRSARVRRRRELGGRRLLRREPMEYDERYGRVAIGRERREDRPRRSAEFHGLSGEDGPIAAM